MGSGRRLLALLATPPRATSGERTRRRVDLAAGIIGCTSVEVANLLAIPTDSVLDIAVAGTQPMAWHQARADLAEQLSRADEVLMGWGHAEPTGEARRHHREQVEWVMRQMVADGLPRWTVGSTPRHPSRWQRYTSRHYPDLAFGDALGQALRVRVG